MPSFLSNLLSRLGLASKPAVSLAAFGKHPGWDDHVELGLDTQALAETRQSLYVQGIAGNVDANAWEKLPADQRLAEFDHSLLHHVPREGVLAARLWSSSDGKGRKKYPLVLCAHGVGLSPAWALQSALPVLESLREKCVATSSAAHVQAAVAAAREELRSLPAPADASADWRSVLVSAESRQGLLAVMYQLDRARESRVTCHLRVPAAAGFATDAQAWLSFLLSQSPNVPMWILHAASAGWLDLIIGPPSRDDFFCLLANPSALPLATDIPFNFEAAFLDKAGTFLSPRASPD